MNPKPISRERPLSMNLKIQDFAPLSVTCQIEAATVRVVAKLMCPRNRKRCQFRNHPRHSVPSNLPPNHGRIVPCSPGRHQIDTSKMPMKYKDF